MPATQRIVPNDPDWHRKFAEESGRILAVFGTNAVACHHIGSTAIAGILAKPIIDMLLVVADLRTVDACQPGLARLGYESLGEFGIPGRRYFRKTDSEGVRTHHLHTYSSTDAQVGRHLRFRDFLVAHPEWARAYSELKRELSARFPELGPAYQNGKSGFIRQVEALAENWLA